MTDDQPTFIERTKNSLHMLLNYYLWLVMRIPRLPVLKQLIHKVDFGLTAFGKAALTVATTIVIGVIAVATQQAAFAVVAIFLLGMIWGSLWIPFEDNEAHKHRRIVTDALTVSWCEGCGTYGILRPGQGYEDAITGDGGKRGLVKALRKATEHLPHDAKAVAVDLIPAFKEGGLEADLLQRVLDRRYGENTYEVQMKVDDGPSIPSGILQSIVDGVRATGQSPVVDSADEAEEAAQRVSEQQGVEVHPLIAIGAEDYRKFKAWQKSEAEREEREREAAGVGEG